MYNEQEFRMTVSWPRNWSKRSC